MSFWTQLPTDTEPASYTTTATEDVILPLDATALLIGGGAPSAPASVLRRIVDNAADVTVALADAPTLGAGNLINQRVRGLVPGTVYHLAVSFATGGQVRTMTRVIVCVE